MKEIALAEDHSVRTILILNLMNQNQGKDVSFSMTKAEKLLNCWIEEGYFYSINGSVYFGVRSVAEFGEFLRNKFNIESCHLCKAILLKVRINNIVCLIPSSINRNNYRESNVMGILAMVNFTQTAFANLLLKA